MGEQTARCSAADVRRGSVGMGRNGKISTVAEPRVGVRTRNAKNVFKMHRGGIIQEGTKEQRRPRAHSLLLNRMIGAHRLGLEFPRRAPANQSKPKWSHSS